MKKTFLFFLFLFVFFGVIVFLITAAKKQSVKKPFPTQAPTSAVESSRGDMNFGREPDFPTDLSKQINIPLFVDGKKNGIIGFDALIEYDNQYLRFIGADNLFPDYFDFFSSTKDNKLIISAIKKLTYQKEIYLENMQVANLRFETLQKGRTDLKLVRRNNDKSESNLITEGNFDILDKTSNLSVLIEQAIELKKNIPLTVGEIKLTLIDFALASQSCRDCMTYAKITVEKGAEKKELDFKIGGIAGFLINRVIFDKYTIILKSVGGNSVNIIVYET